MDSVNVKILNEPISERAMYRADNPGHMQRRWWMGRLLSDLEIFTHCDTCVPCNKIFTESLSQRIILCFVEAVTYERRLLALRRLETIERTHRLIYECVVHEFKLCVREGSVLLVDFH